MNEKHSLAHCHETPLRPNQACTFLDPALNPKPAARSTAQAQQGHLRRCAGYLVSPWPHSKPQARYTKGKAAVSLSRVGFWSILPALWDPEVATGLGIFLYRGHYRHRGRLAKCRVLQLHLKPQIQHPSSKVEPELSPESLFMYCPP